MNLRYDLYGAGLENERRHPQQVMRDLGIVYEEAIPQSLGDQWWFRGCENVPVTLPPYLELMDQDGDHDAAK
jgi:hypothetical protein